MILLLIVLFPLFFIRKAQFTKYSDGHQDNLTNNTNDKAHVDKAADLTRIIHKGRAN